MAKVAGVVIIYNPEISVIENINSYINQVEVLYVINNSEVELNPVIKKFFSTVKIKLINNNENFGIAFALNQASRRAQNEGFDFLLTMDQDSKVSYNLVDLVLKEFEKDESIGIISPKIIHTLNPKLSLSKSCFKINVAMTSGSILKLSVCKIIGDFLDKLFIDYVDHEYCLRMNYFGFKVIQLNTVYIYHNLGNVKQTRFLFRKVFPTNHSPLRLYYRTRNRFYVYKVYSKIFPQYVKKDRQSFIKELLKIFLYEREKLKKIFMIFKGYLDYKKNLFGKYPR